MNFEMIKQARELQSKLAHAQKELKRMQVEMESGKGAIKVVMNGEQHIVSFKIDPNLIDTSNTRQLEILIVKAIADCQEKVQKMAAVALKDVTGGLKLPGM